MEHEFDFFYVSRIFRSFHIDCSIGRRRFRDPAFIMYVYCISVKQLQVAIDGSLFLQACNQHFLRVPVVFARIIHLHHHWLRYLTQM